jgi:hypothetical protein
VGERDQEEKGRETLENFQEFHSSKCPDCGAHGGHLDSSAMMS